MFKSRLITILSLLFLLLFPQRVKAQPIVQTQVTQVAQERIDPQTYIALEARKQDVDETLALYIWLHEGKGNLRSIGDMDLTCSKTGKPVRARGGWQITECYHPEISDECAFDLKCSTAFALPIIKNPVSCRSQFSTCR